MTNENSSRRAFLKTAGKFSIAAPVVTALMTRQESFAQELATQPAELDFQKLYKQYSFGEEISYLNHASIGTIPIPVQNAHHDYLKICESNPWLYMWGGAWEEPREKVRAQCAEMLACDADEIAITHNTTEAFNTLAHGLPLGKGDEVLFSSLNHAGASAAFEHVGPTRDYSVRKFEFPNAEVNSITTERVIEIYVSQIRPKTRALIIPHIDNTVGLRHPAQAIAKAARAAGVEFIAVDGAQTVGMLQLNLSEMGVDAYSTSPHKWLEAPKGLGLAYFSKKLQTVLKPMWVTWGQKRWADSARKFEDYGTRNLAEVLTLGDAITFHKQIESTAREQRLQQLWQVIKDKAAATPNAEFLSPSEFSLGAPLTLIGIKPDANEFAQSLFKDHQIIVRPFKSDSLNALRISPNVYNTAEQIARLFELLA